LDVDFAHGTPDSNATPLHLRKFNIATRPQPTPSEGWSANVFLQILDSARFGGMASFVRETGHLVNRSRAAKPISGGERVRVPGESGLLRRERQVREGVDLHPGILLALQPWAERLAVSLPAPIG
jgi:L-lactate dehydrogenase